MVTKNRARVAKVDGVLAKAIQVARDALAPIADETEIGEHSGVFSEGERLLSHHFVCLKPGYLGWEWVVTLARVPRARNATVCEINLLPGDNALLAPDWIPWADRLEPGDIKREDVLPYIENDDRLDQSYQDTNPEEMDERTFDELGLGRPRVLSKEGRQQAAKRWYASAQGPIKSVRGRGRRQAIPENTCSTCGFMIKIAGSLRQVFGVCANQWAPDDGRVVSLDHSCGSHSETGHDVETLNWEIVPPRLNEYELETVNQKDLSAQ